MKDLLSKKSRKTSYNVVLSTYFATGLTFGFGFFVFELAFLFAIKVSFSGNRRRRAVLCGHRLCFGGVGC